MTDPFYIQWSPLTYENMDQWSRDSNVLFSDQDEDLLLDHKDNLTLLFVFLNQDSTLSSKKDTILSALGVMLHDSLKTKSYSSEDSLDKSQIDKIRQALREQQGIVLERLTDPDNDIPTGYMTILYWAMSTSLPDFLADDERSLNNYYLNIERNYLELTDK
jgi:hypothetical protein